MNINEGWFSVVLIMKKAGELLASDCPNYSYINETRIEIIKENYPLFEKKIRELRNNSIDISLIHGLSGIYLLFLLFPQAFEI